MHFKMRTSNQDRHNRVCNTLKGVTHRPWQKRAVRGGRQVVMALICWATHVLQGW